MEPSNSTSNTSEDSPSFPGASFAQAINQLGLQTISTQTSSPSLVPASLQASSTSASSFTARDGTAPTVTQLPFPIGISPALPATTNVPVASSLPQLPSSSTSLTPPNTGALPRHLQLIAQYNTVAKKITHQILSGWLPRYMPPEEIDKYRLMTQRLIERIRLLEEQQARMLPSTNARLEHALFAARAEYRARFPRTFRINDLPTEIFTNILRLVCWSTKTPEESVNMRLYLTWTCRHWRTIAIVDNTLWNAIAFTDYPKYERSFEWLARSENGALDIRITDTAERPWTIPLARDVIGRLFTKLSTIRILVLVLQNWSPLLYILDAFRIVKEQNLPMIIERLEIHRMGQTSTLESEEAYPPEFHTRSVQLFGGAYVPTFNHLTARAVHFDWPRSSLKGLHTLEIQSMPLGTMPSLQAFRKILADFSGLRKLTLHAAGPLWAETPRTLAPIEMPTLRELDLGTFSPIYVTYLVSQFTCANVVHLTMMNAIQENFSPFWHFITGRLPSLRALSLQCSADIFNNLPLVGMAFLNWLQSVPKLSLLRVSHIAPVIMDLLLYDIKSMQSVAKRSDRSLIGAEPTSHPACPELTILEFHNMEPDYIVKWVTARKEMGIPVQKMYVGEQSARKMSPEDRQKLKAVMQGSSGGIHTLGFARRADEELQFIKGG